MRFTKLDNGFQAGCLVSGTDAGVVCTFLNRVSPANVPTLSEWGLIAMAGIVGIAGFMVIRRRKVAA